MVQEHEQRESLPDVTSSRMTIRQVARRAGVSHAVVSAVVNHNFKSIRVSPETRRRVLRVIEECRYYPHAAGKALTTRRAGQLGFILSDTITDGWGNVAFAQVLSGVEDACRLAGYGLTISRYNLTNVDSFVFPPRVGERSVDGLVLTHYVEAAVVQRFREFGVPCVCVGDNVEVAGLIPTVACDIVDGLFQAVRYAAGRGHVRILYPPEPSRRGREVGEMLVARAAAEPDTASRRISIPDIPEFRANYASAALLAEYWLAIPVPQRPTVVITSDQAVVGLLVELRTRGLKCPDDVSVISTCESRLCEFAATPVTAISYDLHAYGRTAAQMLIRHLDDREPLGPEMSRTEPCTLIERSSVSLLSPIGAGV